MSQDTPIPTNRNRNLSRVALCALVVALGCAPEIWFRHGGSSGLGILLCLVLGGGVGVLLSTFAMGIGNYRIAAALILLPTPLLHITTFLWAVDKASEYSTLVRTASIWIVLVGIGLLVGSLSHRKMGTLELRPSMRIFLALSAAILSVVLAMLPVQSVAESLRVLIPCAFGGLGLALAIVGWRRKLVLAVLGACALVVTFMIPTRYIELKTITGWAFAGTAVLNICWWHRDEKSAMKVSKTAWTAVAALTLMVSAHLLLSRYPMSWARARGAGLLSVFVESGHRVTDFDGDGIGAIFAHGDCHPFNSAAHPGAFEIPGNDVDENCLAGAAKGNTAAWVREHEALNQPPSSWNGDLIFVVVDSMRADDAREPSLSFLSGMRSRGVDYSNAYASSTFTSFSLQSILGARIPGALEMEWQDRLSATPLSVPTSLASYLRDEAGYDTALAGGTSTKDSPYFLPNTFGHGIRLFERLPMSARPEEIVAAAERAWKGMDASKPRFLYLHIMWVHEDQASHDTYRQALKEVDEALGEIHQRIDSNAAWVITSDHGDEFGEHGGRYHAATLYEEVVRVPLIIAVPGREARLEPHLSPLRSIPPTLLSMIAPERFPKGLGPYLCIDQEKCSDIPVPMALPMQDLNLHALRIGNQKIIRDNRRGTLEAFDLGSDPGEEKALVFDEIPEELEQALIQWEENAFGPRSAAHVWPYRE